MPQTFFTSDTHFGHSNALKWPSPKRDFSNIHIQDEHLISCWNESIKEEDTVYFLGDFAYKCSKSYAQTVLNRLNGHKIIILGNHDRIARELTGWSFMTDYYVLTIDKQLIILFHYPILSWLNKKYKSWHLHGHVHGKMEDVNRYLYRMDVGVDTNFYCPYSFEILKQRMDFTESEPEKLIY